VDAAEIPKWVKRSFRADVAELDELQYVTANSLVNHMAGTLTVFIAISKERFMLSSERAEAYMMDRNKEICFKITFGKYYCGDILNQQRNLTEVKPRCPEVDPQIVQAVIKEDRNALTGRVFRDGDKCAMAWYLENRLKTYFQGESSCEPPIPGIWPPLLEPRGWERPILKHFIRSEVRQVMQHLECNEGMAEKILEECGEDIEMAVNFMNDRFERYSEIMEEFGDGDEDASAQQQQQQKEDTTTPSGQESERVSREQKRLDAFQMDFETKLKRLVAFAENVKEIHLKKGMPYVNAKSISGAFLSRGENEAATMKDILGFIVPPVSSTASRKDAIWEWDANGVWTEFDASEQSVLEKAWQDFQQDKKKHEFKFTVKAVNRAYIANFKTMKQVNESSKFGRSIRRELKNDVELKQWEENRKDILEMYATQFDEWHDQNLNRIKEMKLNIKYGEKDTSKKGPLPPVLRKSQSSSHRTTQMKEMECIRRVEDSLKSKNFLISVVHEIMNAVAKYTTHCIMCGNALQYPGAKPAICDKNICVYKFNSVGLGVDIGCVLEEQSDLMKLLIATFYMAAQPNPKQPWKKQWNLKDWQMCYPYVLQ